MRMFYGVTLLDCIVYTGVLCWVHSCYLFLERVSRIAIHTWCDLPAGPCFLDTKPDSQT